MTNQEIFSYISQEHVAHSADARITRIIFKDGGVLPVHFIKDSQRDDLMAHNKWIVTTLKNPIEVMTIDGEDIAELRAGARPFN
jgi:hypothetical protein